MTTTNESTTDEKRMDATTAGGVAAVPTVATAPKRSAGETALIMLALCLAVFLAALDSVGISVALPTIARELGASDAGYAWIGSAYLLTLAALIPFWGKASDIFGRKPMLIIANAIFMVGSLIAALSRGLTMLIAGRAVQGLGGGGVSGVSFDHLLPFPLGILRLPGSCLLTVCVSLHSQPYVPNELKVSG